MTIFTQSQLLSKVLYLFSCLMLLTTAVKAQFCLGLNTRADVANPDEVFLEVTTAEFTGITSMQFSISFDPKAYEPLRLENSNLTDFSEGSVSLDRHEGAITLAWFDKTTLGVTYSEEAPLLTFKFKKLAAPTFDFEIADKPTQIEVSFCASTSGINDCEVLFNFTNCNTGENLVPSIKGQLFVDENENCTLENTERANTLPSWNGWNITASQNGQYYFSGFLKPDGSYEVKLFPGDNLIEIIPPGPYYDVCDASFIVNSEDIDIENAFFENLIQVKEGCPFLEVTLASFPGTPCELGAYALQYSNNGTAPASNVYIDLNMDYRAAVKKMNVDYEDLGESNYRINIGDLGVGESSFVFIEVDLPCDLTAEETLRNNARIFPNEPCGEVSNNWSGASLKVDGKCEGNQIIFEVENIGDADMVEPSQYVVIEDAVILRTQSVKLASGERKSVALPATGASYFMQVAQERGHPGSYIPSAMVEACGRNVAGNFSTGFANRFPEENNDMAVAVDYQLMAGNNTAHRLLTSPRGFSDKHYIEPNNAIEYTIHFRNTSNGLKVIDALSLLLDVTTFTPIAASHPYDYSLENGVLTLDISAPLPNSLFDWNSYIKFSIAPKADLPMGTVISNVATLQYTNEQTVETNTVFHTIETDFIERSTSITTPIESISNLTVFPNPSNDWVVFNIKNWQPINYHLTIMDIDGKALQANTLTSQQYRFQKGDLPAGTYLYRLIGANGSIENGFFVFVD